MERPYAQLSKKPLAAPIDDMEEIVIATLNGLQFRNFIYVDTPRTLQATRDETEVWGNHSFKSSYAVEINWFEDLAPPPQFKELASENEHLKPLLINLKLKDLKSVGQKDSEGLVITLWNELKERAKETAEAVRLRKPLTDHGSARWATVEELSDEGYLQDEAKEEVSTRLLIGTFKERPVSVPTAFTEAHAIIAGPPGVGKSRTMIIPNLIERPNTSAIVTEVVAGEDIKPVVYRMTAGYRRHCGHKVYYINPSDLDNCTRFNPIDFIEGLDDASYYADLIVTNTTEKNHIGDQIWKQSETHLLTALLVYAWGLKGAKKAQEGGQGNLGHLRSLLRFGPAELNKIIEKNGVPEARDRFDEFLRNSSPNFRLGVFSDLMQRLNPWLNPRLIKLTEVTDFSQEDLSQNLFTFYLAYPVHRQDYKPLMALALNFLTKLSLRKTFAKPLTLLLDEFAAYGNIPGIDNLQATIRNRGIGIVLGFQDQQQLHKVYTSQEAEALFTNTDTKILFATGSAKAQQQISQLLGKETRVKKQVSSSGHISKQTFGASLLEPGEIGTKVKQGEVLVIRNKRNPLIAKTCDPGKYNAYETRYPIPEKEKKRIDAKLFDHIEEAEALQFSQQEADQQTSTYERLWQEKIEAQEAVSQAKTQGLSGASLSALERDLKTKTQKYDRFVSPEEIQPPVTKKPVVSVPEEIKQDEKLSQSEAGEGRPEETKVALEKKTLEKDDPEPDLYQAYYVDDDLDPYAGQYAEEE